MYDNVIGNQFMKDGGLLLLALFLISVLPTGARARNGNPGSALVESIRNIAPQDSVFGRVTDQATGDPLPGANVYIKGTTMGVSTDANGRYHLAVPSMSDTLIVSYIGYQEKTVSIRGRRVINVQLVGQVVSGKQLVVIGYGVQKKSDLSSSIATVSPSELQTNSVLPNAAAALEGTTAGVSVTPSSGEPGAGINIRIRGSNTFGNNDPLVIIDGAPGDLNNVNPQDVSSIQVLKDAAAAAIYGSRAANGVVIVTTKQGKPGKAHVSIQSSYSIQSPEKFIPVTNAEEWARIDNELHASNGSTPFSELSDPSSLGAGTNWQKLMYSPAPMYNTYMGISGGDENTTYRVSGSFNKQKGMAVATNYRKALIHYNGHQHIGVFTFNESVSWMDINQRAMPGGSGKPMTLDVVWAQPIIPLHDPDNENGWGGAPAWLATQAINPYGLEKMRESTNHYNNFNSDVNAELHFLKHFTYKINAGYSVNNGFSESYQPTYHMSTERENLYASLSQNRSREHHWLLDNTINYDESIGQSHITALLGYSVEEDHYANSESSASGFPNNKIKVLSSSTFHSESVSGGNNRWDLVSILGRVTYAYGAKYYLTANVRRDGSSRFGLNYRYGTFPSASVAWRISSEPFFNPLRSYVDNLKLRASYGVLGNEPSANYGYIPTVTYDPHLGYLFGGSNFITGATEEGFANPDVKWETTKDADIGVDIRFLDNFTLSADYYVDKTDNVLLNVPIPPSTGTGDAPLVNTGKLQNRGMELSLTYQSPSNSSGFNYNVSAHFSTIQNKVLELGYSGEIIYGSSPYRAATGPVTEAKVGYPIGAFFTMQTDGLFQNQQEIDNWKNKNGQLLQPNAQPGDVRYLDVDGDGQISTADVAYSGSPFPKFSYGLTFNASYRHFDLTLFIQGNYGNKMFDANRWIVDQGTIEYNFGKDLLDAWTPTNTDTNVPRISFDDPNHNSYPSTRFLYDASYLRFKTVQIGYTIPNHLFQSLGVSRLRIYASGSNLLTITKYPGYDPSYTGDGLLNRGLDQGLYPIARIITGGVDINF